MLAAAQDVVGKCNFPPESFSPSHPPAFRTVAGKAWSLARDNVLMLQAFLPLQSSPLTCAPDKKRVCPPQARKLSPPNAYKAVCRSRQCRCPAAPPTPANFLSASLQADFRGKISRSFRMWNWKPLRFPHPASLSVRTNAAYERCCLLRQYRSAVYDCFCALALCDFDRANYIASCAS